MFVLKDSSLDMIAIHIAESRPAMGAQAAADIAQEIHICLRKQPGVRMIFAAAPSQSEMLAALREEKDVDWSRVTAFHMDEYLDLRPDTAQRFGLWLRGAIFDQLNFAAVHLIEPGGDPTRKPPVTVRVFALHPSMLSVAALEPTAIWPSMIRPPTLMIL